MSDETGTAPEGQGQSPYHDYLERIPEDARGVAEEAFRAWDANTTRQFQEAAQDVLVVFSVP